MVYWPRIQPHSNETQSLLSPTLPIQGGTAKKCACLERIYRERNYGRDGRTYLFYPRAPFWLRAPQRRGLSARRIRIHLLAMRRRRRWANRNSGRTARFATAWARGAEAGGLISAARRSVTAIPTPTSSARSTKVFPGRLCRRTERRSRAWG